MYFYPFGWTTIYIFLTEIYSMPKYFFAILPLSAISDEIIGLQKEIEARFGSVHAQKTPPHITVIPPFNCEEEQLSAFIRKLVLFLNDPSLIDIKIELDNFQRFESRALFVDVAKNEAFEKFCKELKLLFNQQKIIKQRVEKHYFIPHITIANKDIKKRDFKTAWDDFKTREYQRSFELKEIAALELKDGVWIVKERLGILP